MDDAFDARLTAAFAAAQPPADDTDKFAEQVIARLGRPNRRRFLVLGGAGTTGSAVASSQLEGFFGGLNLTDTASGPLGQAAMVFNYVSPETLAAVVLAGLIGAFAFMLPSRA